MARMLHCNQNKRGTNMPPSFKSCFCLINPKNKNQISVSFFLSIIIAVLLTACGAGGGNTDSGTTNNNESVSIGPNGGTVTSSDGKVKVVIPSGALSQITGITVAAVSNQPSGNIGTAYEFGPDGTTFNQPVTISITYDEASLPSGVSESDIKLGTVTNNQWEVIADSNVNTVANIVSGTTTHLSTYGVMVSSSGTVPSAPTGVTVTAGDGQVTISWNAASVATSYNIYWSTTSGVTKSNGTKISNVTTPYIHTGRANGTTYYYVVTAVNSFGESSDSSQVTAMPLTPDITLPDTSITGKPSNPSNLSSASFSFSSTETGSTFQCQIDNGGYSTCTSPKLYAKLTDGSHTFEVKATDASGNTDPTPASYAWAIDATSPANTTGTNFINSGDASTNSTAVILAISVTDNVGVTGYYASEDSTTPSASASGWTSVSSTIAYSAGVTFTLSSLEGTKTVYVWFKDAAGNISSVANDSITLGLPPSASTGVAAAAGDGKATISWNADSGATSYNIYWSTTSGVTKSAGTKISNVTSPYTHTGRTNGTTYYYVVTTVNDYGESAESSQVLVIPQAPISLPKTGQTISYATGDDGDLQRGVVWPSPRFTDNGNGTVTDNLTGLIWTKDGNVPGPAACSPATGKTWQGALDYVACLNTNSYLGYTDWRLPNVNELRSLIHYGQSISTWIFNNVQYNYWSSTSYADSGSAWIVYMPDGSVYYNNKYLNLYVWPVRSGQSWLFGSSIIPLPQTGQTVCYDSLGNIACTGTGQDGDIRAGAPWPSPRFTDNGDGTVTDNLTGLIWTKDGNAPGPAVCAPAIGKTWQAALDYVACLNANSYLGYADWCLPNINEIASLVNGGQTDAGVWLNTQGFDNVQHVYYWSSTSYAGNSYHAWIVDMFRGHVEMSGKSNDYYVWPVRFGQ